MRISDWSSDLCSSDLFLYQHGISTARAVRIYKTFGVDAIGVIQQDPYCLAREIRGIGFKSADLIAQKVGIAKDSPLRARAGISHILLEATNEDRKSVV